MDLLGWTDRSRDKKADLKMPWPTYKLSVQPAQLYKKIVQRLKHIMHHKTYSICKIIIESHIIDKYN